MPTFETPGPIAATVEVAGAQVRVIASARTDTVVLVEPLNKASRKDIKVADKTKVEFAGGQLSVKTRVAGDKAGSVAITIDLPTGSSLAAYLAFSNVTAGGSLGDCELHIASGRVQLDRVNGLRANIASGEVTVRHVAGNAVAEGAVYGMRIGEIDGAARLSNASGQAWIGHASADLDLSSATGDFDVDLADASITAKTASGAIRIGRMTNGRAKLMNGSGNIEVGISQGVAASIDANSERGAVHSFVAPQGNAGPSDAKVMVYARTRNGDVIVQNAS